MSKVTPGGVVGTFASGFNTPAGVAFDAAGSLYVANAGAGTVSEVVGAAPPPVAVAVPTLSQWAMLLLGSWWAASPW